MKELQLFEGIIEITQILNTGEKAAEIGSLSARFVRYPGSQQLQVWLPERGDSGYGQIRLIDCTSNVTVEEYPVTDKLSGSVQMLWDTLGWKPGEYRIEIENPQNGLHCLYLTKRDEDIFNPKNGVVEMPMARAGIPSLVTDLAPKQESTEEESSDSLWKVYLDGFGNPIPNLDQQIRDRAFEGLRKSFERHPGEKEVRLVEKRREVLLFVASGVKRHFAVTWRFEIDDCSIRFF